MVARPADQSGWFVLIDGTAVSGSYPVLKLLLE
jgi:hypothetical protein